MPRKLNFSIDFNFVTPSVDITRRFTPPTVNVGGDKFIRAAQEISTDGTVIMIGDIENIGYILMENKNTSPDAYIEFGYYQASPPAFYNFLKLKAGEVIGPLRVNKNTLYARAFGENCIIEYIILED